MKDDQLRLDLPGADVAAVAAEDASDDALREEQRTVVELAADYVVTAGAGSGKTRTLVALYSALRHDHVPNACIRTRP